MKFSFYIAKRYLLAKKSSNAINIISAISIFGVAVGTLSLIVILSVYNGLDGLVKSLYNSFDPDIKITAVEGKTFERDEAFISQLRESPGVLYLTEVIEENILLRYRDRQHIAIIKGVSDDYTHMSGIDTMIIEGSFTLKEDLNYFAVIGQGIQLILSFNLNTVFPVNIYVPKNTGSTSLNLEKAFNKKSISPKGIFAIEQGIDSKYMIVPIEFARELLDYPDRLSAIEIKTTSSVSMETVQDQMKDLAGEHFKVQNRYEQHEFLYKIMKTEKWAIFFILSFILIIASFNLIGSLTMLIIDKREDISVLISLGANDKMIRNIFFMEGWLISLVGAVTGLVLGATVCILQQKFALVKLQGSGSFVMDAYPVDMQFPDFVSTFLIVLAIGFVASWYPVKYLTRKHVKRMDPGYNRSS